MAHVTAKPIDQLGIMAAMKRTLGLNLRERRESLHLTQEDVQNRLNIKQTYISRWERNRAKPSYPRLMQLARVLETTVDALLLGLDQEYDDAKARIDLARHVADVASTSYHDDTSSLPAHGGPPHETPVGVAPSRLPNRPPLSTSAGAKDSIQRLTVLAGEILDIADKLRARNTGEQAPTPSDSAAGPHRVRRVAGRPPLRKRRA